MYFNLQNEYLWPNINFEHVKCDVRGFVFLCLVYPMLPVSLDCPFFYCPFGILLRLCAGLCIACVYVLLVCICIVAGGPILKRENSINQFNPVTIPIFSSLIFICMCGGHFLFKEI